MTQTISDEVVQVCRVIPLHNLVGLQSRDRVGKIVCPFHAERTASCSIFPNNGRYNGGYKCFGCGAHGNSVDFLVKLGASFDEAIEELIKQI